MQMFCVHCLTTIHKLQYNRLFSTMYSSPIFCCGANVTGAWCGIYIKRRFYTNKITSWDYRLQDVHVHIEAMIESFETMHRRTHGHTLSLQMREIATVQLTTIL